MDNWFSSNKGAGVCADKEISAAIFTGNRVEWNRAAGFKLINPICVTINGNAFDASGGPGIDMRNPKGTRAINVTITGNNFHRSGMPLVHKEYSGASCHLHMERVMNIVLCLGAQLRIRRSKQLGRDGSILAKDKRTRRRLVRNKRGDLSIHGRF